MCTYITVQTAVAGSGKGPGGKWTAITDAQVYFDHPAHTLAEHTLNIDLRTPTVGPAARIALELSPQSARDLIAAIQEALDSAPAEIA
jgi:uncharacterized protein DUF6295